MSRTTEHLINRLERAGRAPGGSTGHFPRQKCLGCGKLKRKAGRCSHCGGTVFLVTEGLGLKRPSDKKRR